MADSSALFMVYVGGVELTSTHRGVCEEGCVAAAPRGWSLLLFEPTV
jgi:hypothetical protein